jgi:DNA-binding response OmpR family regulator
VIASDNNSSDMQTTLWTILLADDDPHTRDLVHATLSGPDYRILEVDNGRQLLAHCDSDPPDLVVLDWMMPGISGLEVARELGRRARPPAILMLTARHQTADAQLARDAGVTHYLTKPFSPLELIARVEELLPTRLRG